MSVCHIPFFKNKNVACSHKATEKEKVRNEGFERNFIEDETKWLIKMGAGFKGKALSENFGGYWPEHNLYTEEYIQGETLDDYLKRNKEDIKDKARVDRWQMRWLHFIWSGTELLYYLSLLKI